MLASVARRLLLGDSSLFRRLGIRHILTVKPKHAAAIDRSLEPPKGTIDILLVADLNADAYMMGQMNYLDSCVSRLLSGRVSTGAMHAGSMP